MESCDTLNFWKSWKTLYSKNRSNVAPMVNGCTSKEAIAETFRTCFQRNSELNNSAKVDNINKNFSEKYAEYSQSHASAFATTTESPQMKSSTPFAE